MNTYRGLHADNYDLIFSGKPYAEEARWVAELLPGPPGALLDVACGTGRHAAVFGQLGYDVTGVDLNQDLLDRARTEVPGARFIQGDMRELGACGLPKKSFTAITCLFDSIGYPQTNEGIVAALSGMRELLSTGGRLVAEFLHAPAMVRDSSPVGVRRWPLPDGGELLRVSETSLDIPRGRMEVSYELVELRGDGSYARHDERQGNRYLGVDEMGALLTAAGLKGERFLPAYQEGEVSAQTFHVAVVAS